MEMAITPFYPSTTHNHPWLVYDTSSSTNHWTTWWPSRKLAELSAPVLSRKALARLNLSRIARRPSEALLDVPGRIDGPAPARVLRLPRSRGPTGWVRLSGRRPLRGLS